jgi:acyl-coenzyme A synthetase/AMP-(fatty) acid ligase
MISQATGWAMEIESALVASPMVIEAAVVSRPGDQRRAVMRSRC